ncbi:MAG: pyridoxine 5'-phosphate synthase, partial [Verrucomicrobiota bacterium]
SMHGEAILEAFRTTAISAQNLGLHVNAGHDLSLENLSRFLTIPGIEEVSIGHALIVECIEHGISRVIGDYLDILEKHAQPVA